MGIAEELGAGVVDDGTYDLSALKEAKEAIGQDKDVNTSGMVDVEPIDIEVVPHVSSEIHHTDELEARMIIITYDRYDNVLRVEIL